MQDETCLGGLHLVLEGRVVIDFNAFSMVVHVRKRHVCASIACTNKTKSSLRIKYKWINRVTNVRLTFAGSFDKVLECQIILGRRCVEVDLTCVTYQHAINQSK